MESVAIDEQTAGLPDGLTELDRHLPLRAIMDAIASSARWVDPETFKLLPVWYPEHARGVASFKAGWIAPRLTGSLTTETERQTRETNVSAQKALFYALDAMNPKPRNWSCCHIWSTDDPKFQKQNAVVKDRRFYSCVANMVLLPTPLKAFTDAIPEVKAMLRFCAANLYGWSCDHDSVLMEREALSSVAEWDAYPDAWPRSLNERHPPGVCLINDRIRKTIVRRQAAIRRDLKIAGDFYPREEVRAALAYWQIEL